VIAQWTSHLDSFANLRVAHVEGRAFLVIIYAPRDAVNI
jgi:hypothetical protein